MDTVDRRRRGPARARAGRIAARALALCLASASASLGATGCRVNEDDIHRWESTAHGPEKLRAVLLHEKYEIPLRVEAAVSLVRMKPRQGQRLGVKMLVDTLADVAPESRQIIVAQLVPAIINELKKPPPVAQAGQTLPPDGSYPYKDAAYAMLNAERAVIIADEALKQNLKNALVDWAMADFEHRLENRTQMFGMEQLLRFIGPGAVAALPKLMTRDAKRLEQMASFVADWGDAKTKDAASAALVAIATYVMSDEWVKVKKPELQAANAASKLEPTEKQFEAQLAQYQDEELFRVFGSMKKVGGRPAIDFCLNFAAKKEQSEKRRQAALAALEGRLDRSIPDDIKRIVLIATGDAPDGVLDQAFRRMGEMPRELVVERLYELFRTEKWKVRRAAAATVLKMSTLKNVDEFMSRLPAGPAKGFAMGEALTYGAMFGDLKEGNAPEVLRRYFSSGTAAARSSALAYWFTWGTSADVAQVQEHEGDKALVPVCETDPDCKWVCEVPKEGAKETESKDIKTIGEFVRFCIEPAMKGRSPEAKKTEKKDDKK
jgi:hypothetical protein